MILINGKPVELSHYPAGEQKLVLDNLPRDIDVEWIYSSEEELVTLIYVYNYAKRSNRSLRRLYIPYAPNGRMDRVKSETEVFTLKHFCGVINSFGFLEVVVNNPHSDVTMSLLNNVRDAYINDGEESRNIDAIYRLLDKLSPDFIFYPDFGCAKKYEGIIEYPYLKGDKTRDWRTGKIEKLNIIGTLPDHASSALIVDDICSYGGTFLRAANALKEIGVEKIWLYVTHCENSVLKGDLIKSGAIEKIYTTKSIFTAQRPDLIEFV